MSSSFALPISSVIGLVLLASTMQAVASGDEKNNVTASQNDGPSISTPGGATLLEFPDVDVQPHAVDAPPIPGPARVHVLINATADGVSRQMVQIADLFPERSLEFKWLPANANATPVDTNTNLAQGEGVLIWRIPGLPPYDLRSVFARYEGTLRDGYPQGRGKMRYRSGATYSGDWRSGRLHGAGRERTANGEYYVGSFANGRRHGAGRLVLTDRTILDGYFENGVRHGRFSVKLPGGRAYSALWQQGVEIGSDRPNIFLDSTLAGLLKAQSGDAASRVALSVVLDAQTSAQSEFRYLAAPGQDRTLVYTEDSRYVNIWNGSEPIPSYAWEMFAQPWDEIYAYLNATLQTSDGRQVALDRLWLEVASSTPYQKPMLHISPFYSNTAFSAKVSLFNHGWGAVTAATLNFRITDPSRASEGSPVFSINVLPFERDGTLDFETLLLQNGVDIEPVRNSQFPCPSREVLNQCFAQALSVINLGNLAPYVGVSDNWLVFSVEGDLTYSWINALGEVQTASQPLRTLINIAQMQFPDMAEQGSGWSDVPEAPRHVEIVLPVGRNNYRIDLPFRAGASIRQVVYPMKFRAAQSSIHDFRVGAQFRDGSIRYSAPVTLFYFRPRD